MEAPPTIAIVGRPNVGKSTLFNRLIGKKHAVVAHEAGTTRDRIYHNYACLGYETLIVDTGGLEYGKKENIESDIQLQAKVAIEEADLILFVLDISQELTVDDFSAADILRKSKKPVILVANKSDHKNLDENIFNFYELGFDEPIQISAIHKLGIETLESKIAENLKKAKFRKSRKRTVEKGRPSICILGRPNAGKSSLANSMLGSKKIIVSDIPGTTRDSIDTEIDYEGRKYTLIDTAGLKRRGKIKRGIDKFSSLRAIQAIERSDVVVLLIDGNDKISNQDAHIAEFILEAKKGFIIGINKIDLFENEDKRDYLIGTLRKKFSFVPWAPLVFLSAKSGQNIFQVLNLTDQIMEERRKRVSTSELNSFLHKITQKHLPNSAKMKKPKFMYATQAEISPPTFTLFFNNGKNLHFSYPRYIENEIRKEYGFTGTGITIKFKNKIRDEGPTHR